MASGDSRNLPGGALSSKTLVNAVKLVVAVGSFAAKPDLLTGLKSGVSIHETLTKMLGKAPASLKTVADELAASASAIFDGFARDLPADAEILYEQMVVAALPDAAAIVSSNMDAARIVASMRARHSDREHLRAPMPDLFDALTVPVLERMLKEKSSPTS